MKKPDNFMLPFVLAPLVATICIVLFDVFFGSEITRYHYNSFGSAIRYVVAGLLLFYIYSLFFSLTIGILSFYIARYVWKITWYIALIGGFIDGVVGAVIINYFNNAKLTEAFELDYLLPYAIYGAITGLAFWFIWKRGNPTT